MAVITNTSLTFSSVGNRESLADKIYMISPVDTPFQSRIKDGDARAVLHEWQADQLVPAAANAHLEGDDSLQGDYFSPSAPATRLQNRCQISRKEAVVSGTQEAADRAGREGELAWQLLKRNRELRRDMEFVLLGNQKPDAGSSSTPRRLRPLCGWFATNTQRGSGGRNGSATGAATDGTPRPLTETMLQTAFQQCFVSGGNPGLVMVGPAQKQQISAFSGNGVRMQDSGDRRLVSSIDIYRSDFGEVQVVPNRFQRPRDVLILDTSYWKISYLRRPRTEDLAKTGDNMKAHIVTEYTLEAGNESASAIIADIS